MKYIFEDRLVQPGDRSYFVTSKDDLVANYVPVTVIQVNKASITVEFEDGKRARVGLRTLAWKRAEVEAA